MSYSVLSMISDVANLKDLNSETVKSSVYDVIKDILVRASMDGEDDDTVLAKKFATEFNKALVGIANDILIDLDNVGSVEKEDEFEEGEDKSASDYDYEVEEEPDASDENVEVVIDEKKETDEKEDSEDDLEEKKEWSKDVEDGSMRKILEIPEDKTIADVFESAEKAVDKLVATVGKEKAASMINYAANLDPDDNFLDKMQRVLSEKEPLKESYLELIKKFL